MKKFIASRNWDSIWFLVIMVVLFTALISDRWLSFFGMAAFIGVSTLMQILTELRTIKTVTRSYSATVSIDPGFSSEQAAKVLAKQIMRELDAIEQGKS